MYPSVDEGLGGVRGIGPKKGVRDAEVGGRDEGEGKFFFFSRGGETRGLRAHAFAASAGSSNPLNPIKVPCHRNRWTRGVSVHRIVSRRGVVCVCVCYERVCARTDSRNRSNIPLRASCGLQAKGVRLISARTRERPQVQTLPLLAHRPRPARIPVNGRHSRVQCGSMPRARGPPWLRVWGAVIASM